MALGNAGSQSHGRPLLAHAAIMFRAAASPGLLFLFSGVFAGPEQTFAAGKPVAEGGAAVADAESVATNWPRL